MFKYRITIATFLTILFIVNVDASSSSSSPSTSPAIAPLAPSDFQKNGGMIPILESGVQDFVKAKETDELNYGLHLIGFDNQPITDDPKIKFITDYSRMSCNTNSSEVNLPECANQDGIYSILSPSNIFNSLNYQQANDLLISQTLVRYLLNPFPSTQLNSLLKDKATASDSKNQAEIANLIANQVPIMVAKNSLHGMLARRYVDPETTAKKLPPGSTANSIMQIMHDESIRRLTDANWFTNLNNLPTNQLLMELLQVEAFKLWMEYNKFQQNERIEALLATLISSQAGQANAISSVVDDDTKKSMKESKEQTDNIKNNLPSSSTLFNNLPTIGQ